MPVVNISVKARIIARYLVGLIAGSDLGNIIIFEPTFLTWVAGTAAIGIEVLYAEAVKRGWAT